MNNKITRDEMTALMIWLSGEVKLKRHQREIVQAILHLIERAPERDALLERLK